MMMTIFHWHHDPIVAGHGEEDDDEDDDDEEDRTDVANDDVDDVYDGDATAVGRGDDEREREAIKKTMMARLML